MIVVADAGVADGFAQEGGDAGDGDAAEKHFAAAVALVFQVDGAGAQLVAEGFEVCVGADDLDAVVREDAGGGFRDVDPETAAEDGDDLDAETLAEVQLRQRFAAPFNLGGNVEVRQVQVLGKKV